MATGIDLLVSRTAQTGHPARARYVTHGQPRHQAGAKSVVGLVSGKMTRMEAGVRRVRLDPDTGERFLSLRRELGVTSFGMNQIVLQAGQRGRIHRHERQEEVYLVLDGTLTLIVEEEEFEVGQGELIRVAPSLRRQLVNRRPGRVVLVALGGAGEHQGRDGEAFASWTDEVGASPQEIPLPADLDPSKLRS
jgi:mannose-6-phosphate isomerase-like protein (cupin superfamily)